MRRMAEMAVSSAKVLSSKKTYGGVTQQWSHQSHVLGKNSEGEPVTMKFSVFLPPTETPVPVIYWLSGLIRKKTVKK